MPRECDGCTLCCTVLGVTELKKGLGQPCREVLTLVCGTAVEAWGCGIYPDRPDSCRQFRCVWLQAPSSAFFPLEFKPDEVGACLWMIPGPQPVLQVFPDPEQPDKWQTGDFWDWLWRVAESMPVQIVRGQERVQFRITGVGAQLDPLPAFCPCGLEMATECGGECGKAAGYEK